MTSASRGMARLGALIALLGGAWFVLGPIFSPAFSTGGGAGPASTFMRIVTPLGYHSGTGLVIALLSALPGRCRQVSRAAWWKEQGLASQNRT